MGRQRGQTSIDERNLIIFHFKNGKTYSEIGKIINRSRSTVQSIIKRYKKSNVTTNKKKTSSRKIFTSRDESWIVGKIKDDPKLSAPKLAQMAKEYLGKTVCGETIRNVLRKHEFHGRVPGKKTYINPLSKNKTLNFAKTIVNMDFNYWKNNKLSLASNSQLDDESLEIKDEPIPGTSYNTSTIEIKQEPMDVNVEPSGINTNLAPFELKFDDNNSAKCDYNKTVVKSEQIDPSESYHEPEKSVIPSSSIQNPTGHSIPPPNTLFETIKVEPSDPEQFIDENADPLFYCGTVISTPHSNQNSHTKQKPNFATFGKSIAEQLALFPVEYALVLQEKIQNLLTLEKQKFMLI